MSYLVLARKYRPQNFDEVVRQGHIIQTLTNAISSGRVAHAVLFSGPRGTGKTTVARLLAKAMNCEKGPTPSPCNVCRSCAEITGGSAVDVFEIDGASNNSVDQIRDLRENIKYMPAHSLYKIYIIDEVHMLSVAAFNALLKSLEEPPAHIMFIFATTEPHKIPITILSRCQRHDFRRIDIDSILAHLEMICRREEIRIAAQGLWLIAREAGGSMRDALSLLDQVMACSNGEISGEQVLDVLGVIDRKVMFDISGAVFSGDIPRLLDILDKVYTRGHDMKKLFGDLLEHFRNLLLVKMGDRVDKLVDLPAHEIDQIREQTRDVALTDLRQTVDFFFKKESAVRFAMQPKLALEMAFVELARLKPALPIDVLIEKLESLRNEISAGNDAGPQAARPDGSEKQKKASPEAGRPAQVAEAGEAYDVAAPDADADLDSAWKRIYNIILERYPSLATYLVDSIPVRRTGSQLEIEVNGNGFNINMIRREKNMTVLKKVLSEFFGEAITPVIHAKVITNDKNREKKVRENDSKKQALSHPLVAEALAVFNGNVIDVKVLQEGD